MTFVNRLKGYLYFYSSLAKKNLKAINKNDAKKIDKKIQLLVSGARNIDVIKLAGFNDNRFRL